jgi:hypothetical protein
VKTPWTPEEKALMRAQYPDTPTADVARQLGRPIGQVYQAADRLGLKKSAEYLAGQHACRLRRDDIGKEYRFQKGNIPANKGLRRPGWAPGRMAETQFKPGHFPVNTYKPLGTERVNKEGHVQRKRSDSGPRHTRWVSLHVLLWTMARGPVPDGHAITFSKPWQSGMSLREKIDCLEMVSRAELLRRNSVQRFPPELRRVIQLRGVLSRKIRNYEKQAGRPA